jgi:flagellar basal-body rod protein FlgC
MDALDSIISISTSGMRAQSERMKIIAENVANAEATGATPGSDPYRRKLLTFSEEVDRASGASMVRVNPVTNDTSSFPVRFDPAHPAADAQGFVKLPNVSAVIEMANMREASRSYEANMNMFEMGRQMRGQIVDMLK